MGDWYPDEQKDIVVPEKKVGTPGVSYVYLWVVPVARRRQVAGQHGRRAARTCRSSSPSSSSSRCSTARVRVGSTTTQFRGRISNGDQITFTTQPKDSPGNERHEFRGKIAGDTIEGTVRIGEGAEGAREQIDGARDRAR